jgi:prepilin-type N-terminal cleavage/methylation domain-containing protein
MSKRSGMTLIEIMITMTIVAIVLSVALITMKGYLPKQRLLASISALENLAQRAQAEASARSYWTCIRFSDTDPIVGTVYVDVNGNHGSATTACGDTSNGDYSVTSAQFKSKISFASGAGCTKNITAGCAIWFDTTGAPKVCKDNPGPGNCGATDPSSSTCLDNSFQIILSSSELATGAKARELEILSGGLIQTVKPIEKGLGSTNSVEMWAKNPTIASGAGECE